MLKVRNLQFCNSISFNRRSPKKFSMQFCDSTSISFIVVSEMLTAANTVLCRLCYKLICQNLGGKCPLPPPVPTVLVCTSMTERTLKQYALHNRASKSETGN